MTEKRVKVYKALREYVEENGYSPSLKELCDMVDFLDNTNVYHYLRTLKEKGFINYVKVDDIEIIDL